MVDKTLLLAVRERIRQRMLEAENHYAETTQNDHLAIWLAQTIADIDEACWPDYAVGKHLRLVDLEENSEQQ